MALKFLLIKRFERVLKEFAWVCPSEQYVFWALYNTYTYVGLHINTLVEQAYLLQHCPRKMRYWTNLVGFYPNVNTLRSGLCCRNSVCRLSVCCLSVTLVHPTQGVEPIGKISSPLCTLAILWPPCKILRKSSQGNPSVVGVKCKRCIKIQRF